MKCLICGRNYVAVGVHTRHKHQVTPEEYRAEFGLLKTAPLIDADLSEHISRRAKERLLDPDYLAEVQARIRAWPKPPPGAKKYEMSPAGRERLAAVNRANALAYLHQRAPEVAQILRAGDGSTVHDVTKALGMGPSAVKKMVRLGLVPPIDGVGIGKERATHASKLKQSARVARVMAFWGTTPSAAAMCRSGGIGKTTYQRWVAAGLIEPHPGRKAKVSAAPGQHQECTP